jgi:hypothetical protein
MSEPARLPLNLSRYLDQSALLSCCLDYPYPAQRPIYSLNKHVELHAVTHTSLQHTNYEDSGSL